MRNQFENFIFLEKESEQNQFYEKLIAQIEQVDFNKRYELKDKLGEGHFSTVNKCMEKSTGKTFAVKIMNKSSLKKNDLDLINQEKFYMKIIKHQNIVSLQEYIEDDKNIYIIMNCFDGGDLINFMENMEKNKKEMTEKIAAKIIKRIANGIQYLNNFGIVHRDIKPENIVFKNLEDPTSLVIIDLGVAQILTYNEKAVEPIGTVAYIAPEIFLHKPYSFKVDVWSLGIILYLIISGGILPFDDENLDETKIGKKVVFLEQEFPKDIFGSKSNALVSLIDKTLEKNPDKRININEFLKDYWVTSNGK